jgi:hypothetical protein
MYDLNVDLWRDEVLFNCSLLCSVPKCWSPWRYQSIVVIYAGILCMVGMAFLLGKLWICNVRVVNVWLVRYGLGNVPSV